MPHHDDTDDSRRRRGTNAYFNGEKNEQLRARRAYASKRDGRQHDANDDEQQYNLKRAFPRSLLRKQWCKINA